MTIKDTVRVLKAMKEYYNNVDNVGNCALFDLDDNEAIDKAIKLLEQKDEIGRTHQKLDRNLFKEIMSNADKMCAFVQMQRGIHDFIEVMEDIDIKVDVQSRREID